MQTRRGSIRGISSMMLELLERALGAALVRRMRRRACSPVRWWTRHDARSTLRSSGCMGIDEPISPMAPPALGLGVAHEVRGHLLLGLLRDLGRVAHLGPQAAGQDDVQVHPPGQLPQQSRGSGRGPWCRRSRCSSRRPPPSRSPPRSSRSRSAVEARLGSPPGASTREAAGRRSTDARGTGWRTPASSSGSTSPSSVRMIALSGKATPPPPVSCRRSRQEPGRQPRGRGRRLRRRRAACSASRRVTGT